MSPQQLISLGFLAFLLFIIVQLLRILQPFLHAICWGGVLAFAFFPLYGRLSAWCGQRQRIAAFLTTLLIILVLALPLLVLAMAFAREAGELYGVISQWLQGDHLQPWLEHLKSRPVFQMLQGLTGQSLPDDLYAWFAQMTHALGTLNAQQLATFTKGLLSLIVQGLLTMLLVFVFLYRGQQVCDFLFSITPLETPTKQLVFTQIQDTLSAVIRGQLLTSITQGVIATAIYLLLGLPLAVVLGFCTFITTFIPIVGTALVWFPIVVVLVLAGEHLKAAALFALGVGVISLIDNFMKPALIGGRTKLPYVLLLFAMLGGVSVYGFLGVVLAPVILSLFFALVTIYRKTYLA